MTPAGRRTRLQAVAGVVGELLLTAAAVVGLLVVWLLWWTGSAGSASAASEVRSLQASWGTRLPAPASPEVRKPPNGTAFAVLHIPRFGAHWQQPVLQGTNSADLRKGIGHYTGTAMPGVAGNFAVAGHRTTWSHPFGDVQRLRTGDSIVVETKDGWFSYRVTGHEIVRPSDRSVIASSQPGRALLTLTTCHPKYSAQQRWIVHAELVTSRARSAGPPAGAGG